MFIAVYYFLTEVFKNAIVIVMMIMQMMTLNSDGNTDNCYFGDDEDI